MINFVFWNKIFSLEQSKLKIFFDVINKMIVDVLLFYISLIATVGTRGRCRFCLAGRLYLLFHIWKLVGKCRANVYIKFFVNCKKAAYS